MTRNLKALGLALIAVFAMTAIVASAAQAAEPVLTTEGGVKVKLDGTQTEVNVLTREGRTVQCAVATFESEAANLATTLTVKPKYESCTSSIGPATVTMNECDFLFHLKADAKEPEDTWTAVADLVCPAGKQVEIHIYSSEANHKAGTQVCTYKFGSQNGKETIDLTNQAASSETPKNWILADVNVGGIVSTSEGSTLICGPKENATATLKGGVALKGTNAETGAKVGITISTH